MKEILSYLKPYRAKMAVGMIAVAISTLCDLMLPTIMSAILNEGVAQRDLRYIVLCCALMLAVAAVGAGTILLGFKLSSSVAAGFCEDLRADIFRKVNQMRFEEFGKFGTAALVTRATYDVQTVSWVASEIPTTALTIPVLLFGGMGLAMVKDAPLALLMLVFVPVIVVAVRRISRKVGPLWDESDANIDKLNSLMQQRLRGIRVIRAFNAEPKEQEKIAQATCRMSDAFVASNVAEGVITPLFTFLLNLSAVLIVYFGALRMESGSGITGGDVFAIVQYVTLVANSIIMGAWVLAMLPRVRVAAKRIAQVLDSEAMADPVARQPLTLRGEIVFDHVYFSYEGAAESALKDITLSIRAGRKVAIIGGTGAGKSTLVSMLMGFRMPTQGRVLLDDMDTAAMSRHTMRENMSCVLQNTAVYSGTVRENVAMGRLDATDEQIMDALGTAQASQFVSAFPEGLDHTITQSGKNLSGGQKQRLCIARAVLKDAPIYIFDDSFSALDFLTEANLRKALDGKIAGKTQLIITQRVSTAMHCDEIVVMDAGAIVGRGTHAQLMRDCPIYREICQSQTGGAAK